MYVAQIDEATGAVRAVVELAEPVEPPPQGVVYVELQELSPVCGKYYYDNTFNDTPEQN